MYTGGHANPQVLTKHAFSSYQASSISIPVSGISPALPGNPGLLDWYTPFLEALYEKSRAGMSVLAHAFVGHTPSIDGSAFDPSATSLAAQVEHALEVVDALKSAGCKKIVIAGHSVGTWVSVQVVKSKLF